jgi:hypothetical protein
MPRLDSRDALCEGVAEYFCHVSWRDRLEFVTEQEWITKRSRIHRPVRVSQRMRGLFAIVIDGARAPVRAQENLPEG